MSSLNLNYQTYRNIDLDETGVSVIAAPARLQGFVVMNTTAGTLYLKFYDQVAAPTVGTDTPALTIAIPAGDSPEPDYHNGILFKNGIGVACTTGAADNDTGAPASNALIANIFYT